MGRSKCYKVLSYSRQGLTDYDLHNLFLGEESATYEEVDFSQNKLSSVGLRAVVDLCCRCHKLRVVKLYKNEIDDSGAKHLARLLQQVPSVEEFHLSHNRLTAKGVRTIVKAADGARSASARPLWMRLEMNEIQAPDQVLLDLESNLSVCGREDEVNCTARSCCWNCKTHLPFLNSQREPRPAPAQNTEQPSVARKGKGVAAAPYCTQSKTWKDPPYGDASDWQPSSSARKGEKGKGNTSDAARTGKDAARKGKWGEDWYEVKFQDTTKSDYTESQLAGTGRKGKRSSLQPASGKDAQHGVDTPTSDSSPSSNLKAKKTYNDEEKAAEVPKPALEAASLVLVHVCSTVGCGRETWNGRPGTGCCRTCHASNGLEHGADCERKFKLKGCPPCAPAASVEEPAVDQADTSDETTDKDVQSQDKPNTVESVPTLESNTEDQDSTGKPLDAPSGDAKIDLAELLPGAGVEKDENVVRLQRAHRARDFMRTEEDEKQVAECLVALNKVCEGLGPEKDWRALAIGSVASGFGTKGCDIDVVVKHGSAQDVRSPQSVLLDLRSLLTESDFTVKNTILQARVPILKLQYKDKDIDLSACNIRPMKNTRLLKAYSTMHERVAELVVAVKIWAKDARVCGAKDGHLSSYALVLMVIYFLQVVEDLSLPCLQEGGAKDAAFETDEATEARVKHVKKLGNLALSSLDMLIGGFFAFYAGAVGPWGFIPFDWGNEVVSVRLGRRERRDSDAFTLLNGRNAHRLHIEDPFERSRNLNDVLWMHPVANEDRLYQHIQCMDSIAKMLYLEKVQTDYQSSLAQLLTATCPLFPPPIIGAAPFLPPPIPIDWDPSVIDAPEPQYSASPDPKQRPAPPEPRSKTKDGCKTKSHTVRRQFGKKGPYNSTNVHGRGRA